VPTDLEQPIVPETLPGRIMATGMITTVESDIGRYTIKIRDTMQSTALTIEGFVNQRTNCHTLSENVPDTGIFVSCTGKLLTFERDRATVILDDIVSLERLPLPM
jgi:hypothetical protein